MNYCAMDEAFNNSLKKQNSNNNNNNNLIPPNTFDNYGDIDVNNNNNIFPAFFTAQGDYADKGPYFGTDVKDLKNTIVTPESEYDNLSFLDNKLSEESYMFPVTKPKKLNHSFCISKMVKSLLEDSDTYSMASSDNNGVYSHVRKCKYCKTKINERMKEYHLQNNYNINQKENETVFEYFDMAHIGYNLKEILIIILAGIVLIFILDLLVKIGRKMKK